LGQYHILMDKFGHIYGKPFVKNLDLSAEKALRRIKASVLYRVRQKLFQSNFSERAKKAFHKAIQIEQGPSSLTIFSNHPGFTAMMRGRKKAQMSWLVKARAPIPIITEAGDLIFRTASVKSMRDGKWVHPGKAPYDFIDKAKQEAKVQIKKAILAEMKKVATDAAKKKVSI
jgi:hypothetical protein